MFLASNNDEKLSVLLTELHMGKAGKTGGRALERHHRIGTEGEGGDRYLDKGRFPNQPHLAVQRL